MSNSRQHAKHTKLHFWPTPSAKGETFDKQILNRRDLNICFRSISTAGNEKGRQRTQQLKHEFQIGEKWKGKGKCVKRGRERERERERERKKKKKKSTFEANNTFKIPRILGLTTAKVEEAAASRQRDVGGTRSRLHAWVELNSGTLLTYYTFQPSCKHYTHTSVMNGQLWMMRPNFQHWTPPRPRASAWQ